MSRGRSTGLTGVQGRKLDSGKVRRAPEKSRKGRRHFLPKIQIDHGRFPDCACHLRPLLPSQRRRQKKSRPSLSGAFVTFLKSVCDSRLFCASGAGVRRQSLHLCVPCPLRSEDTSNLVWNPEHLAIIQLFLRRVARAVHDDTPKLLTISGQTGVLDRQHLQEEGYDDTCIRPRPHIRRISYLRS